MEEAAARLETQVSGQIGDGVAVVKNGDDTDAAVRAFREARQRQERALRSMTEGPHRVE